MNILHKKIVHYFRSINWHGQSINLKIFYDSIQIWIQYLFLKEIRDLLP